MAAPDDGTIRDALHEFPATLVPLGSSGLDGLPPAWKPIADAADPAVRRSTALALWPASFLTMAPGFARALRDRVADVRVAHREDLGHWLLVYVLRTEAHGLRCWVGCDPATVGEGRPVYWDLLPEPVRDFLLGTHSGFTSDDALSHGVMAPALMETYAQWCDFPDGPIPGWDGTDGRISSEEMMIVTTDGGQMHLCVSPHAPPGAVVVVYEGDVTVVQDLGAEIDMLMTDRAEHG